MLTQKEHDAMVMFDRLLMAAEENETVADLLDQTLTVARLIDPKHDEKITYGPLQRMHFEWQQMKYRMDSLEKKMDNYINNQNRYPGGTTGMAYPTTGSTTMWPSNPGWDLNSIGGFSSGYGPTPPITAIDVKKYHNDQNIKDIAEKLRNIAETVAKESSDPKREAK